MLLKNVVTSVVSAFLRLKRNAHSTLDRKINTYKKHQKINMCLTRGENVTTCNITEDLAPFREVTTELTTLELLLAPGVS